MEKLLSEIPVTYTDNAINGLLRRREGPNGGGIEPEYSKHFSQNEEFFLTLPEEFTVSPFPIHHDIDKSRPEEEYLKSLRILLEQVVPMSPNLFQGLTYYFDPTDILRPGFFQLYKIKDLLFLYLLQIDISFRTHYGKITKKGGNDRTHTYTTRQLFVDTTLIPLSSFKETNGKIRSFQIDQLVTKTWVGEKGKGYFVQGIWIDLDLTKFFSKLFLPKGKRSYPYYPFICMYRSICHSVLSFDPPGRKQHLANLYRCREFLLPYLDEIQETLKEEDFRDDLPLFLRLKEKVPAKWTEAWNGLQVKAYLNERDMKEFSVDYPLE